MASPDPISAPANLTSASGDALALRHVLLDAARSFDHTGDALESLNEALRSGDATTVARASRALATELVTAPDVTRLPSVDQIEAAMTAAASDDDRRALHAAAERLAISVERVQTTRARIGTLPVDLAMVNGRMLEDTRAIDGRDGTYDRSTVQRTAARRSRLLDTSA